MSIYANHLTNNSLINLINIIGEVCTGDITGLVKNPDTDFTRRRKLPLDEFLKVTLNMQGGSFALYKYYFNTTTLYKIGVK